MTTTVSEARSMMGDTIFAIYDEFNKSSVPLTIPRQRIDPPDSECTQLFGNLMALFDSPAAQVALWDEFIRGCYSAPAPALPSVTGEVYPPVNYADVSDEDTVDRLALGLRARYPLANRLYFLSRLKGNEDAASFLLTLYSARENGVPLFPSAAPLDGEGFAKTIQWLGPNLKNAKGRMGEIIALEPEGEFRDVGIHIIERSLGDVRVANKLNIVDTSLLQYMIHYKFLFSGRVVGGHRIVVVRFPGSDIQAEFYGGEPCLLKDNDVWLPAHVTGLNGTIVGDPTEHFANLRSRVQDFMDLWNECDQKSHRVCYHISPDARFIARMYVACYRVQKLTQDKGRALAASSPTVQLVDSPTGLPGAQLFTLSFPQTQAAENLFREKLLQRVSILKGSTELEGKTSDKKGKKRSSKGWSVFLQASQEALDALPTLKRGANPPVGDRWAKEFVNNLRIKLASYLNSPKNFTGGNRRHAEDTIMNQAMAEQGKYNYNDPSVAKTLIEIAVKARRGAPNQRYGQAMRNDGIIEWTTKKLGAPDILARLPNGVGTAYKFIPMLHYISEYDPAVLKTDPLDFSDVDVFGFAHGNFCSVINEYFPDTPKHYFDISEKVIKNYGASHGVTLRNFWDMGIGSGKGKILIDDTNTYYPPTPVRAGVDPKSPEQKIHKALDAGYEAFVLKLELSELMTLTPGLEGRQHWLWRALSGYAGLSIQKYGKAQSLEFFLVVRKRLEKPREVTELMLRGAATMILHCAWQVTYANKWMDAQCLTLGDNPVPWTADWLEVKDGQPNRSKGRKNLFDFVMPGEGAFKYDPWSCIWNCRRKKGDPSVGEGGYLLSPKIPIQRATIATADVRAVEAPAIDLSNL